jgi:hypothetical protein
MSQAKQDINSSNEHPLKAIAKFIFQQAWLNQESNLNEDSWPEIINFKIEDIPRLVDTLTHDHEESLLDVYLHLFIDCVQNQ